MAVRKSAEEELEKIGPGIKTALIKALDARPSVDVTQRLERLLRGLDERLLPPDEVRILRVLEVVEAIGNEEARALCRRWSDGATGELLTEEARTALARLSRGR